MSRTVKIPYGYYMLHDGTQINFGLAHCTENGWWSFNDAKMGRGYEGQKNAEKLLARNTQALLEKHDWPTPKKVGNPNTSAYVRGGFKIHYETVFGTVSTSYDKGKLEVSLPIGIWWNKTKECGNELSATRHTHTEHFEVPELQEYVANPLAALFKVAPYLDQYIAQDKVPWMDILSVTTTGEVEYNERIKYQVGPADVILLRGGYKRLAKETIQSAQKLFDAFRVSGITISTRTGSPLGEDQVIESITIHIPAATASNNYRSKHPEMEIHAEPHDIEISLAGINIRCGYVEAEATMLDYHKMKAAEDLADLAGMFKNETVETKVEVYEW